MLLVLTFLAFCAATAYISAPFWSHRSTPVVVASLAGAGLTGAGLTGTEHRRRIEAEAEIEILVARTRRRRHLERADAKANLVRAAWQCTECGRAMGHDDRFCASCGTARPTDNA